MCISERKSLVLTKDTLDCDLKKPNINTVFFLDPYSIKGNSNTLRKFSSEKIEMKPNKTVFLLTFQVQVVSKMYRIFSCSRVDFIFNHADCEKVFFVYHWKH